MAEEAIVNGDPAMIVGTIFLLSIKLLLFICSNVAETDIDTLFSASKFVVVFVADSTSVTFVVVIVSFAVITSGVVLNIVAGIVAAWVAIFQCWNAALVNAVLVSLEKTIGSLSSTSFLVLIVEMIDSTSFDRVVGLNSLANGDNVVFD